jgi:hypothetical protein
MHIQRLSLDFSPSINEPPHLCIYIESPPDPNDTQLGHYLIATWAKVCQAMGPEFEPYLPVVMPSLLATAGAKADLSLYRAFTPPPTSLLFNLFKSDR